MHVHVGRKDDIFRKTQLNHSEMGEGDYGTQRHTAEPYSCFHVCVLTGQGLSKLLFKVLYSEDAGLGDQMFLSLI